MASAVNRPISSISAAVGTAAWSAPRSPITKTRRAPWGICAPTSMARGHGGEGVEVLGEGLPGEVEAGGEHGPGDVLDAFHQVDEQSLSAGPHRGEADPAVAHDDRGDAVPRRRRHLGVPMAWPS